MEKTLLYVELEPTAGCWQILMSGQIVASHDVKDAAIELAKSMALNRHEVLGERSGVVYPICGGERVCLDVP